MKKNIIFDASVLVTSYLSGSIFKTGLYRVTYEVLLGLSKNENYSIYLYDVFGRERELRKHLTPEFSTLKILSVDSNLYKIFGYPLFNLADYFRLKQLNQSNKFLSQFYQLLKNSFHSLGSLLRSIERKRNSTIFSQFNSKDIYFSTYQSIPNDIPFLDELQKIIIVHDLIPILYPDYFYKIDNKHLQERIIQSISDNDKVVCVSENTKKDFLGVRPSFDSQRVYVSLLAGSTCFQQQSSSDLDSSLRDKYAMPANRNYFLSVCTIEPRKNISLLINAYEKLLKENLPDLPILVLTGAYGWKSQSLLDSINRINEQLPGSILLTGFVTDDELAVLYSNTIAFVYPSLYEGFGLPPLEAMQCGAPVITSDNSSLPEVVGDAGILINANDESALYTALKNCLDVEFVRAMRAKSLQRAKLFSWDRMVDRIVDVIEN